MKRPIDIAAPDELARRCRYVADAWRRFGDAPHPGQALDQPDPAAVNANPEAALRRYRQLQSVHILWRDLTGQADISQTGQALSALARDCLEIAMTVAEARVARRHGRIEHDDGQPVRVAVMGLGKLGGEELNFNSDIDLVFARAGDGRSSGPKRVDAAEWTRRVVRELIALIDAVTPEGRVWIVDTRLRPFGDAGRLVWSMPAMEQYFLSEGRTWERYAWLKAAPVAGDRVAGQRLIDTLTPFIYRRYLDYGIFDSLRELHQRIDDASRTRAAGDDIKRGRGGIRELEFLVQSLQILRGGREPQLRQRGFLPALQACGRLGLIDRQRADELTETYAWLRILENRLQAMTGRQGHGIPADERQRANLAWLMGYTDFTALSAGLRHHRERVRKQFSDQFRHPPRKDGDAHWWPPDDSTPERFKRSGFEQPDAAAGQLRALHENLVRRALSAEGRRRLERLMPRLIAKTASQDSPDAGFADLLRLVEQISRRSAYLALLHERPETLSRLVRVFQLSQRIAEWIIASPQLLDDLLDPVHGLDLPEPPTPDRDDREGSLWALGRWRQAGFLRTALAELDERLTAEQAAEQLSFLADTIVDRVLTLVTPTGNELAVVGYGNLGARRLHYESDLDLVFVHRAGEAPLRAVQRLINALQMPLPGGRLFEIDTRLRPNGRAGLLVTHIDSFRDYQRDQAWTWEHQALIRARWVAGEHGLAADVERVRREVLCRRRDADATAADLAEMRRRQLDQRRESQLRRLLIDIQFMTELGILVSADRHPALIDHRDPAGQLAALATAGWIEQQRAHQLIGHWRELHAARHRQWLQREPELTDPAPIEETVRSTWAGLFAVDGSRSS